MGDRNKVGKKIPNNTYGFTNISRTRSENFTLFFQAEQIQNRKRFIPVLGWVTATKLAKKPEIIPMDLQIYLGQG